MSLFLRTFASGTSIIVRYTRTYVSTFFIAIYLKVRTVYVNASVAENPGLYKTINKMLFLFNDHSVPRLLQKAKNNFTDRHDIPYNLDFLVFLHAA